MTQIHVIARDGSQTSIATAPGLSLMELLRDNGFDELMALCGGCCSCATCHVYVEQGPEGLGNFANDDENDLLDSSNHRQENSRLSCQLQLDQLVSNITVRIAPED
jgi:ferredoxin